MPIRSLSFLVILTSASFGGEWRPLIDKDLSLWEVWTGVPQPSLDIEWEGKAIKPKDGKPMGLGDPLKIYTTEKAEDGSYHLKISGKCYAGLTTKESFKNYHFSAEVKWGEKKWAPRLKAPRDSGILYHCHGEHGTFWNVWKSSLEYQVQERDNGDYFKIGEVSVEVPIDDPDSVRGKYTPGKPWVQIYGKGKYASQRSHNVEKPGEWNKVEVITIGDRAVHLSNGEVVNEIDPSDRRADPDPKRRSGCDLP